MKRLLLLIWIMGLSFGAYAKDNTRVEPYKPLSAFKGDTIRYVQYNFGENKARYIGQKLELLLRDYELPYGMVEAGDGNSKVVKKFMLSPLETGEVLRALKNREVTTWLWVTFKEPGVFDLNPEIEICDGWINWMEADQRVIAWKMKDLIIGDIEVHRSDEKHTE